jgi:hypothetical protein
MLLPCTVLPHLVLLCAVLSHGTLLPVVSHRKPFLRALVRHVVLLMLLLLRTVFSRLIVLLCTLLPTTAMSSQRPHTAQHITPHPLPSTSIRKDLRV